MADDDLEELARLCASTRQLVLAVVLAIVLAPLTGWLLGAVAGAPVKVVSAGVLASIVAAMIIAVSVRTPPDRFPSIRVLRDRPQDVAYVVTIARGKQIVALAGRDGALLAKPLVIKGTPRPPSAATADAIIAAQSAQLTRALALVMRRSPRARLARISDTWGLASFAKLANKAIAALPPA